VNALLFLAGLSSLYPIYINPCEGNQNGTNENCAPQNIIFFSLSKIGEFFSETNNVNMLATVAIAAFTYSLMVSTKRMWLAVKSQGELTETAFAQLEGPLIEGSDLHLELPEGPHQLNNPPISIKIKFKNRGRGPGFITRVCGRFVMLHGGIIPRVPDYGKDSASNTAIGAGEELSDFLEFRLEVPNGDGQAMVALFFYGYVRYRGVFGGVSTWAWGYMPNKETGRFDIKGGDAYNYRRYEK
jgi:hypothetical protein